MYRIGFSRDIHRLEKNGRDFVLGGIKIPFEFGNVSHSDGDCLYHAIGEALLGALSLGDLGHFFPDTDKKYLDYDSSIIVKECFKKVKEQGYVINNIDIRSFGSQGQQRLATLSLKLAELNLFKEERGEMPILLLGIVFR